MKYFNVLTENERQKTQLSEFITAACDKDIEIKDLLQEREKQINELYGLRMDINRRLNQLEERDALIQKLQNRLNEEREQAMHILGQERELSVLRRDIGQYAEMLG